MEDFRSVILEKIDEINRQYEKMNVNRLVPCICKECENNKSPHFFNHADLIKRKKDKKTTIECVTSYENVNVIKLLDGISFGGKGDQMIEEHPRTGHLKNLMLEQYNLLNEYETKLITESDPQEKLRINQKISEIKSDIEIKESELRNTNSRFQNEIYFEETKYIETEKPIIKPETKEPIKKKNFWKKVLKILGVISIILGALAALAELSGFSLRDLF